MFRNFILYLRLSSFLRYFVLLLALIVLSIGANGQDFVNLYGNSQFNTAYRVKYFNDAVYTIGQLGEGDTRQSVFSKYDLSGNIIWQAFYPSGTALRDFDTNGEGQFMIVGRTLPSSSSVDNRSILSRIDDNGASFALSCLHYFDQGNREGFNNIQYRTSTGDYLILSTDISSGVSDQVFLITAGEDCSLTSKRLYDESLDDQFAGKLIPEASGRWTMLGNKATGRGIYVSVNPDLSFYEAFEMTGGVGSYIYDGIAVGSDKIIVGETDNNMGFISEVAPGGTVNWALEVPQADRLYQIDGPYTVALGSGGTRRDYFVLGLASIGGITKTVVYKFRSTSSGGIGVRAIPQPTLEWARYLDQGETDYSSGWLDFYSIPTSPPISPAPSYLAYTDGRSGNPSSFGDRDALVGSFDLELSSCLTQNAEHSIQNYALSFTEQSVSVSALEVPIFTTNELERTPRYSVAELCECAPDEEPPVFDQDCPLPNISFSIPCNASCGVPTSWPFVSAMDNCDEEVNLTSDFSPTDCFPVGSTLVTYTATDNAGNKATCTFNVIVTNQLTERPRITACPSDVIVSPDDPCEATVPCVTLEELGVTGGCGMLTVSQDPDCGTVVTESTTITVTVTDELGRTDQCTFELILECPCPPIGGVEEVCDAPIDVLFVMDNSGSVSTSEFNSMVSITQNAILDIESMYSDAQYAVVHYAGNNGDKLWIEHDFTDAATAQAISRQSSGGDDLNAAFGTIIDALNGNPNTNIQTVQSTLNLRSGTNFLIITFTDAWNGVGAPPPVGGGSAMRPYTNTNILKAAPYNAKFTVVHFETFSNAVSAAIASPGGTYTGPVDINLGDPTNGTTPRQFINATFGTTMIDILPSLPPCDSLVFDNCCDKLFTTTTQTSTEPCCYAVDIENNVGSSIVKFEAEITTPDWQFNSGTVQVASGFSWSGVPTNQKLFIEHSSGSIPSGMSNDALEFCLSTTEPTAATMQEVLFRWYELVGDDTLVVCVDTFKTNCAPPPPITCVEVASQSIECNSENPYEYFLTLSVTNNSGFDATSLILQNIDSGFGFSFCGTSFSAASISVPLSPAPLISGNTSNNICVKIVSPTPILSPTDICFQLGLLNDMECCHALDSVCVTLAPCCDDVCEQKSVVIYDLPTMDNACCYSLDLVNNCEYDLFTRIETEIITPGVNFGYHGLGGPYAADWAVASSSPTNISWTPIVDGTVNFGVTQDIIQFCLDDIDNSSEIPQQVVLKWYSNLVGRDSLICTDTLTFNCDQEFQCVMASEQNIECDTIGNKYDFTVTIKNASSIPFDATDLFVTVVSPADLAVTGIYPLSPPLSSMNTQTVSFPIFSTGTFPSNASEVVLQYRLAFFDGISADTCCFENILDTIPLPDCGGPCKSDSIDVFGTLTGSTTYRTERSITSDAILESGAVIAYKAEETIRLIPNFHAKPGSDFVARIEPCDTCNLVVNGDFQEGNTGFMSAYMESCICAGNSYCIGQNAKLDKCSNSLWGEITSPDMDNYMIVDASSGQIWAQNVTVTAGELYEFSFDFYPNVSGIGSPTMALKVNGTTIASGLTGTIDMWNSLSGQWTASTTGSVLIEIEQTTQAGSNGDYGIDNVVFTNCDVTPPPTLQNVEQRSEPVEQSETIELTNYPNPFTNSTIIAVEMPKTATAKLMIFDLNGKMVYQMEQIFEQGKTAIEFQAQDLDSGLYIYRLQTAETVISKSMMLMRD